MSPFEAQVLPHLDAAYRFARWLAPAPGDADDIVQDAILRAFRGFDGLRGTNVRPWLLAIVRNCHATALKRQMRGSDPLPDDEDQQAMISPIPDPETAAMHRDAELAMDRLLRELPREHREVLVLREIEELDYREIAAVIQAPIGTVMSRLARARSSLRARWSKQIEEQIHGLR